MMNKSTCELLKDMSSGSSNSRAWLEPVRAGAQAAGLRVARKTQYEGASYWLTVYGVAGAEYALARDMHIASGRPVACWDVGYLGKNKRDKELSHFRVSLNRNHPSHQMMDLTTPDRTRWKALRIELQEYADPKGPVLIAGMSPKARDHIRKHDWEINTLKAAIERFPGRQVIYRPKNIKQGDEVEWPFINRDPSIYEALKWKSLVICKHSNVAIDACIMGIPVECEDGAAHWLYSKTSTPTVAQRLDLLHRICWWQWKLSEMEIAWKFLISMHSAILAANVTTDAVLIP